MTRPTTIRCETCGATVPVCPIGRIPRFCTDTARCRKASYARPCIDCGAPTSGSDGVRTEPRCVRCANAKSGRERVIWSREQMLEAGRWWIEEYGEPPAAKDWWSPRPELVHGDAGRAQRFAQLHAEGRIPHARSPIREFGSWNAFVRALGHEPRSAHGGGGNEQRRRSMRARAGAA